jgi:hypothetical protein
MNECWDKIFALFFTHQLEKNGQPSGYLVCDLGFSLVSSYKLSDLLLSFWIAKHNDYAFGSSHLIRKYQGPSSFLIITLVHWQSENSVLRIETPIKPSQSTQNEPGIAKTCWLLGSRCRLLMPPLISIGPV